MTSEKTVIAFDLYGTLLSTESIGKELAKHYGDDKAKALAAQWRRYQLEYTWRVNSMGKMNPDAQRSLSEHLHTLDALQKASLYQQIPA